VILPARLRKTPFYSIDYKDSLLSLRKALIAGNIRHTEATLNGIYKGELEIIASHYKHLVRTLLYTKQDRRPFGFIVYAIDLNDIQEAQRLILEIKNGVEGMLEKIPDYVRDSKRKKAEEIFKRVMSIQFEVQGEDDVSQK
tara:strand:+ start:315 stop:737 length:423 start_codon:yes stop_codon:yes gene_type:complete